MPRLNIENPAEEFLYEQGLIDRRSMQRRALLGCVGCRWLKATEQGQDAKFYGFEVIRCTRVKSGIIYPILSRLTEIGVIVREREDVNPSAEGRPPRIFYYPADSELGEAFLHKLELPQECSLELDAQTTTQS